MPAPLEIIVTNAGRAAIVNAQNTGTAPVTIAEIGLSGTAVVPLPGATALPSELKRISSIAGEVVGWDEATRLGEIGEVMRQAAGPLAEQGMVPA